MQLAGTEPVSIRAWAWTQSDSPAARIQEGILPVLLSASMIVRNEARYLEGCLLSIKDLVDEVLIVDTGSTDGTQEIARQFGARLYDFEWCDDFSAARNEALRFSSGAWILYIDADERVRPTSRVSLRRLLRKPSAVGYYVQQSAHKGYTPYWEMRLFRNDPRIRFEGIIHENIGTSIKRYLAMQGGELGYSRLVLDHLGNEGPQDHKHRRYLPLLLKAVACDPSRVYCWSHLGTIYRELGQLERAREAWWAGIAAVRRQEARRWSDSVPYVKLIKLELASGNDVGGLLEEALRLFPEHPRLLSLRGWTRMRAGRYGEAIDDFNHLALWHTLGHQSDGRLGFSERLFGALPYEALTFCYLQLGQYDKARQCSMLAQQLEPAQVKDDRQRQIGAALPSVRRAKSRG